MRYLFLVILLPAIHVCAQDTHLIDSLRQRLNTELPDTTRAIIMDKLSNVLPEGEWEINNEKTEQFVSEKLRQAGEKERLVFTAVLASAYNNKSIIYKYKGDIAKALEYGEKSLTLFTELNDRHNMGIGSYNNGRLYYSLGDIARAVRSFEYALKMIGSSTDQSLLPYCLNMLGFISKEQQELEKAMEFHQRAYTAATELKDDEALAYTITCRALVLFEQKHFTEAKKNFADSWALYKKIGDVQNQAAQLYHLGQVGYETGQYQAAMKNDEEALALYTRRNDRPGLASVHHALGKLYFQLGNAREAEMHFQKSLTIGRELGFPAHISSAAEGLYKLYRQQKEVTKALEMHELFVRMRDSVNNEVTRKNVLKAQYRYEFEMKLAADSIRTAEEKIIFQARLSQEKTQRYALIIGIVLVLVIAGFAISQLRVRKRLEELKLRNQIASDLHDEVGSAISSISLFAGMARMKGGKEADHLVEKIEEASRETINNMSDIVWSIEPANDRLQNMVSKMRQFGEHLAAPLHIAFQLEADAEAERLSLDMRQRKNVYLVYKEAVNNACKHAQPTAITVTLRKKTNALVMTVSDNGRGFDVTQESTGYGTGSMKARAAELNGKLEITSSKETGTLLQLTVPC